jgi:hypothetical protein
MKTLQTLLSDAKELQKVCDEENISKQISVEKQIEFYENLLKLIDAGLEPAQAWSALMIKNFTSQSLVNLPPLAQALFVTELEGYRVAAIQSYEIFFSTANTQKG